MKDHKVILDSIILDYRKQNYLAIQINKVIDYVSKIINKFLEFFSKLFYSNDKESISINNGNIIKLIYFAIGVASLVILILLFNLVIKKIKQRQLFSQNQNIKFQANSSVECELLAKSEADKQNYNEAVRHIFQATILTLKEKKIINHEYSKTNYEVFHALKNFEELQNKFNQSKIIFEKIYFGQKDALIDDFKICCDNYDSIKEFNKNES